MCLFSHRWGLVHLHVYARVQPLKFFLMFSNLEVSSDGNICNIWHISFGWSDRLHASRDTRGLENPLLILNSWECWHFWFEELCGVYPWDTLSQHIYSASTVVSSKPSQQVVPWRCLFEPMEHQPRWKNQWNLRNLASRYWCWCNLISTWPSTISKHPSL